MDIISYALSKKGMQQSVSDYLDEHLTNPTNPPLDTSLSIAGAAADSKATGDKLSELKEELSDLLDANVTWIDGMYITAAWGTENAHASYKCTDFIPVSPIGKRISFGLRVFANVATYALYDKDKHFISSVHSDSNTIVWVEDTVEFNAEGVMYVRFTTQKSGDPYVKASSHFTDQLVAESIGGTLLADGSISSDKFQSESVTISKLSKDVLVHDENTNLINYDKVSAGYYIDKNGTAYNSSNVNATDFIPLTSGKTYYQNHVHNTYYAFYDGSYQFLTGYEQLGNLANSFTVPTGASFGRFTILDRYYGTEQAWISTKNAEPKSYKLRLNPDNIAEYAEVDPLLVANPCDYTGRDVSAFTKCICIGDSLTEGTFNYREDGSTAHYVNYAKNSYPTYFQKLTGIETVNKGHGGSTTIGWWNTEQNTDLSGFDMAIIQLGANDLVTGQTEWPAESKTALSNIISKLITENNNIKVFVANIIPATSYPNRDHISTGIKNLVTELANPNVIFLDMAQYSHVGKRTDYNCGHLSAYGYWRLAQDYANYIGHIMATDKADVFREIQFIGTNYQFHA